jgi:hypothetical protein
VWRLVVGSPRGLYRWNERRYETRRVPYAVLQATTLGVLLCGYAVTGAVGSLVAVLWGEASRTGFWVGVAVAGVASMLALVYLLWGGLLEWLAKRGPAAASAP